MEGEMVCRVCLAVGVRMYDVKCNPVKDYLEAIVGINPLGTMLLPSYVCYECEALARKYYMFKEKCMKGQAALYDMLSLYGKVWFHSKWMYGINTAVFDKNALIYCKMHQYSSSHLAISLSEHMNNQQVCLTCGKSVLRAKTHNVPLANSQRDIIIACILIQQINVDEIEQVRANFKLASTLTLDDQSQFIDYCYQESGGFEDSKEEVEDDVKEEPFEDNSLHFSETLEAEDLLESIKEESDHKDFEVFLNSPVSSDDEPLSTHKRNKTELEKGLKENGDVAASDTPVKRKRGRPRKNEIRPKIEPEPRKRKARRRHANHTGTVTEEDDVDLDLENYVDIVILSPKEQLAEVEKRKESPNYQNASFQCSFCFKGFIDATAWEHHRAKHDPSAGNIACPVCKIRFKNKRAYMKHYANHEKRYQCKACPNVSKTSTQAKQHQRWHKGVTYKCQHCDEVSTKWTSYLSHVRMKHPSDFICNICGYSFVSRLGLTMHRTMMHKGITEKEEEDGETKSEESGLYCAKCDVKFGSDEAYKRHMVMSSKHLKMDADSHGCRVCGQNFANAEELRVHHRSEHARKRPKNYGKRPLSYTWPAPCSLCGEQVASGRAYWTHFRRAHPGLPYPVRKDYVCDVCGKSFRGNAFLVYHKRTHTDERAYQCTQCPKAFHNRTNLQIHQKTHSDHRPHPCSVCFKAFKSKGALDRHFRSHTGVKPYECEVCGKAFNQSNSRKLHVRTVHLRQPSPYVSRNRTEKRVRRETQF